MLPIVARIKNKMNINQENIYTEEIDPLKIKVELDEEISIEEHQLFNNIQGYEAIQPSNRFLTDVLVIKQEPEDYISNIGTNITNIHVKPNVRFITEVTIKEEPEVYSYKCLDRFKNNLKYLTVTIPKLKCYMCDHCPVFCKKKKDLIRHIHIKHYLMFRNNNSITTSTHQCFLCNKKLPYKRWYEHMTLVHCDQLLKCNECQKTFKNKRYLKRHFMYVHGNIRPTWRFFRKKSSNNLMSEVKCPVCSKQFSNKHSLKIHTKTCHSEKSYTCKLCNSRLKCKTYLNAHMRRVHYDDGKKHYCDICDKKFKSPRYLSIHKKNSHYKSTKKIKKEI